MRARQHCVGSPIQACPRLQALDMIAQHSRIYILFFFHYSPCVLCTWTAISSVITCGASPCGEAPPWRGPDGFGPYLNFPAYYVSALRVLHAVARGGEAAAQLARLPPQRAGCAARAGRRTWHRGASSAAATAAAASLNTGGTPAKPGSRLPPLHPPPPPPPPPSTHHPPPFLLLLLLLLGTAEENQSQPSSR